MEGRPKCFYGGLAFCFAYVGGAQLFQGYFGQGLKVGIIIGGTSQARDSNPKTVLDNGFAFAQRVAT